MTSLGVIPRTAWLWLLVALSAAVLPLLPQLPLWTGPAGILVLVWRLQYFRQRWQLPGSLLKAGLCVLAGLGLYSHYGRLLGLEPMVALLVLAVGLKLLEIQQRRDFLLVLLLGFFLLATHFLFSQTLPTGLYAGLCLWLLVTALLVLQQPQRHGEVRRSLRLSGRLLLHSVPLLLLLFVVMPRLGSFWSVPAPQLAKTGLSARMSPADFVRLSRSPEPVFRVAFSAPVAAVDSLYWRALVLSEFDGSSWSRPDVSAAPVALDTAAERAAFVAAGHLRRRPGTLSYRLTQEPSAHHWLYSLPAAEIAGDNLTMTTDLSWWRAEPVRQRLQYSATSHPDYQLDASGLTPASQRLHTHLPAAGNPQVRALATKWRALSGSEREYLQRLLRHYREEFSYTLEPPPLNPDWIDDFVLNTRAGFCQHFAGSFVFMARAAGIPARVVVGYQGGEFNAEGNYWLIRQYDAHAWAEVWLAGAGWVRFDPTAQVAPERVAQGMVAYAGAELMDGWQRYLPGALLSGLRLQWDALNYRWQQAVMGYDTDVQQQLLRRWLGALTPLRLALALVLVGGAVLLGVALWLWWQQRPPAADPVVRAARRLQRALSRRGVTPVTGESPAQLCQRAALQLPQLRHDLQRWQQLFEQVYYGGDEVVGAMEQIPGGTVEELQRLTTTICRRCRQRTPRQGRGLSAAR